MNPSEILSLLPHGREARFLDDILELTEERVVCACSLPPNCPYVIDGRAPAFVALELAAQTAAILEAVNAIQIRRVNAPQVGYLVRARGLKINCRDIPAGATLHAQAVLDTTLPPLSLYDVGVRRDHRTILEGSISLFVPPQGHSLFGG